MAKVEFQPFPKGQEEVRRGPGAQALVRQHTEAVRSRAGDGFVASYQQGKSRYRAIIFADTFSAKRREARDNILVRVLG